MCVNYTPATRKHLIGAFKAAAPDGVDWPAETYQDYLAPIIRADDTGARETLVASFGMIPKSHMPAAAKHFMTMNARGEAVGQLRSFSSAWKLPGQDVRSARRRRPRRSAAGFPANALNRSLVPLGVRTLLNVATTPLDIPARRYRSRRCSADHPVRP